MATGNRSSRSPGALQRFNGDGQIADTPDYVVPGGQAAAALEALGGSVSGRLKQMAGRAAAREGELAGLNAGQAAGVGYLERQSAIATSAPGQYDLSRHVTAGREGHLAGIRPQFRGALAAMMAGAPEDIRSAITLHSGYRSEERQAQLFQDALAKYGSEAEARKWVAPPGKSRHNHGDAYDLQYGSDAAKAWVHANAGKYGLAFPLAHEDWHIELASARGSAAPAPPASGGLNAQPLALRNDSSIYGEAFDGAAMRAYGWRMQQGVSNDLSDAYDEFKDDPSGFAGALQSIRERYSQDENFGDPRVRDIFDRTFVERSDAFARSVAQRHEARLMAEQEAAFNEGMTAQIGALEKQAVLLGANPDAEAILGAQAQRLLAEIDHAVEANVITTAQGQQRRNALDTTLAYGRTHGVFAALPTPAAKQAFANDLLTEWANDRGPLTALNFNQVKALSDQLAAQAQADQNRLTAESKAERARVEGLIANDLASIGATGVGLDTAANELTPDRLAVLGIDSTAWQASRAAALQGWQATAGMELETPAELNDRLMALAPKPGAPDFVQQSAIYGQAVSRAQDVLKERELDPLGQAARAGAIDLQPIDLATPETMEASLQLRAQQGDAVASMYGIAPSYFQAEERTRLANAMLDNPQLVPGFAVTLTETFGDRAGRALSEISDAAPELAHAAGIVMATGDGSVALDIARVMTGRRDKTLNVKMPSDAVMTTAAQSIVGPAMALNPGTRASVLNVAGMLFEKEAAALGFDPADIKNPGSAAWSTYRNALDRALGARVQNGVKYGGMAMVNGAPIVAPTSMAADSVEGLVRSIQDADIARLPPMRSTNGVSIGAAELAGGRLLTIGDGQYAVALGDPASLTPNLVQGVDGQPWILDLYALEEIANTRPVQDTFGNPFALPTFWRR